jgi:hypothetical protein
MQPTDARQGDDLAYLRPLDRPRFGRIFREPEVRAVGTAGAS